MGFNIGNVGIPDVGGWVKDRSNEAGNAWDGFRQGVANNVDNARGWARDRKNDAGRTLQQLTGFDPSKPMRTPDVQPGPAPKVPITSTNSPRQQKDFAQNNAAIEQSRRDAIQRQQASLKSTTPVMQTGQTAQPGNASTAKVPNRGAGFGAVQLDRGGLPMKDGEVKERTSADGSVVTGIARGGKVTWVNQHGASWVLPAGTDPAGFNMSRKARAQDKSALAETGTNERYLTTKEGVRLRLLDFSNGVQVSAPFVKTRLLAPGTSSEAIRQSDYFKPTNTKAASRLTLNGTPFNIERQTGGAQNYVTQIRMADGSARTVTAGSVKQLKNKLEQAMKGNLEALSPAQPPTATWGQKVDYGGYKSMVEIYKLPAEGLAMFGIKGPKEGLKNAQWQLEQEGRQLGIRPESAFVRAGGLLVDVPFAFAGGGATAATKLPGAAKTAITFGVMPALSRAGKDSFNGQLGVNTITGIGTDVVTGGITAKLGGSSVFKQVVASTAVQSTVKLASGNKVGVYDVFESALLNTADAAGSKSVPGKAVTTDQRFAALGKAVDSFNKQPGKAAGAKINDAQQDLNAHRDQMRESGKWSGKDETRHKAALKNARADWIAGNYQDGMTQPGATASGKTPANSKTGVQAQASLGSNVGAAKKNTVASGANEASVAAGQKRLSPSKTALQSGGAKQLPIPGKLLKSEATRLIGDANKALKANQPEVVSTQVDALKVIQAEATRTGNTALADTIGVHAKHLDAQRKALQWQNVAPVNSANGGNKLKRDSGNDGMTGYGWTPDKVKANWAIVGKMGGVKALSDANLDKLDYLTKKTFLDTNLSPTDHAEFTAKLNTTTTEKARRAALASTDPATGSGPNKKQISLSDSSGLHPYVGNATSKIPAHKTGTTVIIGAYTPDMLKPGSNRVAHIDNNLMGTKEIWDTNWRDWVPEGAGGPLHIYRTFEDQMTGKRMVLKVDPDKPHTPNIQDKNMLDVLLKTADVDINVPLAKIVDEVPSNVMHNNPSLWATHASMGKVALVGAKLADAREAANIDGTRTWTVQERLARTGLDVVQKSFGVSSSKTNTLPSDWMLHYFKGSGKPKVLDQNQMEILQKAYYLDHPDYITLGKALNAKIRQERDAGRTSGHTEIYLEHDISGESVLAPEEAGLYNTLGGYHPGTVYKIDWTLGPDNVVKATGNKTFIAQDRYNWEVSEFNRNTKTKTVPKIPPFILKTVLPDSVLNKFGVAEFGASSFPDIRLNTVKSHIFVDSPYKNNFVGVTDAMLGRLQMGKGGAQAFTTMGITEKPIKVDSYWNVND